MPSKIVDAAREYEAAGWVLTPINYAEKGPTLKNWQYRRDPIPDLWQGNIGIMHGPSGTGGIDIDQLEAAKAWLFLEHGVDLDFYLQRDVQISSGQAGHGKLLYLLPEPLPTATYTEPDWDGTPKHVIQFRCMTGKGTPLQDVLPPSMHPSGQPYQWVNGDWTAVRMIPDELLAVWKSLLAPRRQRGEAAGPGVGEGDPERALSALEALDPDCDMKTWVRVGIAFKLAGGHFEDFDEWSRGSAKYREGEPETLWANAKEDGEVSAGTLYWEAEQAGWAPPARARPTVEEMFGGIELEPPTPRARGALVNREDVEREIDALTPGCEVVDLLRRATMVDIIRESDTVREQVAGRIAHNAGLTKAAVSRELVSLKKQYRRVEKDNRPPLSGRLHLACNALSPGAVSECRELRDLQTRYIWVAAENGFYDRVTRGFVVRGAFDAAYSHLDLGEREDGGKVRASDALLLLGTTVKVDALDYYPGVTDLVFEDGKALYLNVWEPSSVRPAQGDATLWTEHLEFMVPDAFQRRYLTQWMAFMYRHQNIKINHNVLFGGLPRIGKDALFLPLYSGLDSTAIAPDKLAEPYEDFAYHKKLVVFNELLFAGMSQRKMENKLKPFGAAPPNRLTLRLFGKDAAREQRNLLQIIANTNYRSAAEMETGAERWFCVWSPAEQREPGYYKRLYEWLEGGGIEIVLGQLLQVPLDGFDPKASAPATAWRNEMQEDAEHSNPVAHVAEVLQQAIDSGLSPFDRDIVKFDEVVGYLQSLSSFNPELKNARRYVGPALREVGGLSSGRKKIGRGSTARDIKLWAVRRKDFWADQTAEEWLKTFLRQ